MLSVPDLSQRNALPPNRIATWHRSSLARVKEVRSLPRASTGDPFPVGVFHILLPMSGCFEWGHGTWTHVAGSQHALYIAPDRDYRVTHLAGAEHSLLLLPTPEMLNELSWAGQFSPRTTGLRLRDPASVLLTYDLYWALGQPNQTLRVDELICELVRSLGPTEIDQPSIAGGTARILRAAKEYLHEHMGAAVTLGGIAAAIGASPVYLTNVFKRAEGVPLHQYLMRQRLAEALRMMHDVDDLTGLAYDLGFSSHSHFTSAFRMRYCTTPRAVRERARRRMRFDPLAVRPLCTARGGPANIPGSADAFFDGLPNSPAELRPKAGTSVLQSNTDPLTRLTYAGGQRAQ